MSELDYTADRNEQPAVLPALESRRSIGSRADWSSQQPAVVAGLLRIAAAAAHRAVWQASRSHRDFYSSYPASVGIRGVGAATTQRARGQRLLKLALLQLEIHSITANANATKRNTKVQS